jgi:hypothetical protein
MELLNMEKFGIHLSVLFLSLLVGGCASIYQDDGQNVTLMKQVSEKSCISMGEFSSSVGSWPSQLKNLKNRAAQKGANTIVVKSQSLHFKKQISGMETTTVVEAYRCS